MGWNIELSGTQHIQPSICFVANLVPLVSLVADVNWNNILFTYKKCFPNIIYAYACKSKMLANFHNILSFPKFICELINSS